MSNRNFKLAFVASTVLACACAVAQAQGHASVSFGKRAPTVEELKKAFAPEPKSSALMSMGLSSPVKKTIDMELLFGFGSAEILPKVKGQLGAIGEFMQTAQLGPGEFLIEGHTDAVGVPEGNRVLSERRAQSVKTFLVTQYKVSPAVIGTAGRGSDQLKDAQNPASEANRRVEFSMMVKE